MLNCAAAAAVPMSMFGGGAASSSGMPPLVKPEPEEGFGMPGLYNRRTQAMDLAQDFPAVSAPLYDFHFSSGKLGLTDYCKRHGEHRATQGHNI